jgi:hypothetical protein
VSRDVFVFHGSEIDDRSALPGEFDAWYIGVGGSPAEDGGGFADEVIGPYASKNAACAAMVAGAWLV